jgi:ribosome maturation protein SDO1
MQISNVFMNVSKGEVAKSGDLQKAFGKTDVAEIVKEVRNISSSMRTDALIQFSRVQILKKGEVQVGEKERDHDLTSLRKEIATLVAEKCVDPSSQRPYPVGMIEKAMAEAGFSVKQNKNAKSQVNRHLGSPFSALSDQHSF